jgi:hypothetical protein
MADDDRLKKDGERDEKAHQRGEQKAEDPSQNVSKPSVKEQKEPDEYDRTLQEDNQRE